MPLMPCADEAFVVREFLKIDDDPVDYVCTHCGWLQGSAADGARELLTCATWDSHAARAEYIALAAAAIPGFIP